MRDRMEERKKKKKEEEEEREKTDTIKGNRK